MRNFFRFPSLCYSGKNTPPACCPKQAEEDDLRNKAAGDYQALWIRLNAGVKNDLRNDRFQYRCCVIDRRQRKEMMILWDRRQWKQKRLAGSFGSNTKKREIDPYDVMIVLNIEIPVFLASLLVLCRFFEGALF
jgi:hypothetical protein